MTSSQKEKSIVMIVVIFFLLLSGSLAVYFFRDTTKIQTLGRDALSSGSGGTTSGSGSGGTTGGSGSGGTTSGSGSQVPSIIKVTVNSLTSITIQSDDLRDVVNNREFFMFKLFQDEQLAIPYGQLANFAMSVKIIVDEDSIRNDGYIWDSINPPFRYGSTYWLQINSTNITGQNYNQLGKISFTTESAPIDLSSASSTETDEIISVLTEIGEFLLPFVVGELESILIKSILFKSFRKSLASTGASVAKYIQALFDKIPIVNLKIKPMCAAFLRGVSLRFNMFMNLFRFSLEDISKIVGMLPKTAQKLADFLRLVTIQDIIGSASRGLAYTADNTIALARNIGNRFIQSVETSSATSARIGIGFSKMSSVDLAFLAIGLAGMALEMENMGGLQDWKISRTEDFQNIKEHLLDDQYDTLLKDNNILEFPLINGPLLKIKEDDLLDEIESLSKELIFLPSFKSAQGDGFGINDFNQLNDMYLNPGSGFYKAFRAYFTLSPSGTIDSQTDLDEIEALQIMIDLRKIQSDCWKAYGTEYSRQKNLNALNPRDAFNKFGDAYVDNFDDMQKISVYLLCKMKGGNPLSSGQCSYSEPSACFGSYPWPIIQPDFFDPGYLDRPSPSPKPCSSSPCIDSTLSSAIGHTDFMYSEWRYPLNLRSDYEKYIPATSSAIPIWNDPNVTGGLVPGACVIVNPSTRIMCEATTKRSDSTSVKFTGRNIYDRFKGKCYNTKEICDAYHVSYDKTKRECYWSNTDKATSLLTGSDFNAQIWYAFVDIVEDGIETFIGYFTGDNARRAAEAEREAETRRRDAAAIEARTDVVELLNFNKFYNMEYSTSNDIACVGFKIDKFGSLYVMYAYGASYPTLMLVKFSKWFEPSLTGDPWAERERRFYIFTGPVENCLQSQFDIDPNGNVYIIERFYEKNIYVQQIIKIRPNGTKFDTDQQWTPITPAYLIERDHALNVRNINNPNGDKDYRGVEINGINIRDTSLYVAVTGSLYDSNGVFSRAMSKIVRFSIDETVWAGKGGHDIGTDITSHQESYVSSYGYRQSEEVFSFVSTRLYGLFSLFLNNITLSNGEPEKSRGVISRLNTAQLIDLTVIPSFVTDTHDDINDYPSMCVDMADRILVSNGLRVWWVRTLSPGSGGGQIFQPVEIYNLLNNTDFIEIIHKRQTDRASFKPWECCMMTVDQNNNLCMIIESFKYINLGQVDKLIELGDSYRNIIYNNIKSPFPDVLEKHLSSDPIISLGIDYVNIQNLFFDNNCFDHDKFTVVIEGTLYTTPDPLYMSERLYKINSSFSVNNIHDLKFPLFSDKLMFNRGTSYNIKLQINDIDVYRVDGLTVNESTLRLTPFNITVETNNPGVLIFDNPIEIQGSRRVTISRNLADNHNVNGMSRLTYYPYLYNGDENLDLHYSYVPDRCNPPSYQNHVLKVKFPAPFDTISPYTYNFTTCLDYFNAF